MMMCTDCHREHGGDESCALWADLQALADTIADDPRAIPERQRLAGRMSEAAFWLRENERAIDAAQQRGDDERTQRRRMEAVAIALGPEHSPERTQGELVGEQYALLDGLTEAQQQWGGRDGSAELVTLLDRAWRFVADVRTVTTGMWMRDAEAGRHARRAEAMTHRPGTDYSEE